MAQTPEASEQRRLNFFERSLSLWVAIGTVVVVVSMRADGKL